MGQATWRIINSSNSERFKILGDCISDVLKSYIIITINIFLLSILFFILCTAITPDVTILLLVAYKLYALRGFDLQIINK